MRSPAELIATYFSQAGWAAGLHAAGGTVSVCQRFSQKATISHRGATYHFVPDKYRGHLQSWQRPRPLLAKISELRRRAEPGGERVLLHVDGLVFPAQTAWLRHHCGPGVRIVAQHHGARPFSGWRLWLQRWGLSGVDGFLFTNRELATEWQSASIIRATTAVYPVMETSSTLPFLDKATARKESGMTGSPIVLWTGNLKPNKDPITILKGFARVRHLYPQANLYMAFRETNLLAEVKSTIAHYPELVDAVHLLGNIPYPEMGPIYNSADIFVQGSAREGSGTAVLDALACGVIPVVSDIPPFRTITDNGRLGALWPVGDVDGFVAAMQETLSHPLAPRAEEAHRYFRQHWSFMAVGRAALQAYEDILSQTAKGSS